MRIQLLCVNHDTTAYTDLMLRSLLAHNGQRLDLDILIVDNDSEDVHRIEWATQYGITIVPSGYTCNGDINTHGEVLAQSVLQYSEGCDAFLFIDPDVCFVENGTIEQMVRELQSDDKHYAVQARERTISGKEIIVEADARIDFRSARKDHDGIEWTACKTVYNATMGGNRANPTCSLVRNVPAFIKTVEVIGLSAGFVIQERGARWWDTFGLMSQVMKTHGWTKRTSSGTVLHFRHSTKRYSDSAIKAELRDELLMRYAYVVDGHGAMPDSGSDE